MMAQGIPYYLLAAAALACLGSGINAQQGGYMPSIAVFVVYNVLHSRYTYVLAALVAAYRFPFQANYVPLPQLNNQYKK